MQANFQDTGTSFQLSAYIRHAFLGQADYLLHMSLIQNERVLEVIAGPVDHLPTMERHIRQHNVEPRLSNNVEESQVVNLTCQTVRHRHEHP